MSYHEIELTVNGVKRHASVEARTTLADFLREELRLTGTHLGCEHGVCGACTVLIDGDSARSCITLAVQTNERNVTTVEGVGSPESLHPLQQAFHEAHSFQCGFCAPGIILEVLAMLREYSSPTEQLVRETLGGNICRCTGYESIVRGIMLAAARSSESRRPATRPQATS